MRSMGSSGHVARAEQNPGRRAERLHEASHGMACVLREPDAFLRHLLSGNEA